MQKKQPQNNLQSRRKARPPAQSSDSVQTIVDGLSRKSLDRRIRKALDMIDRTTVDRPLRVAQIAAALNLSPSHMRHLFRREIGTSPTHYSKLLRLRKAKELLATTFLAVKEVMFAVGFRDESHFVRDFKALYGRTPSQARVNKAE